MKGMGGKREKKRKRKRERGEREGREKVRKRMRGEERKTLSGGREKSEFPTPTFRSR